MATAVVLLLLALICHPLHCAELVVRFDSGFRFDSGANCSLFRTRLENLLTATSEQLHAATRGRVQWTSVRVVLPSSGDTCRSPPETPLQRRQRQRVGDADVVIGTTHPLLMDAPWAAQHGGCGVAGRRIYVSKTFVASFNATNSFISGRKMLRQWVKHRYGVFDETGFDADASYPLNFGYNQSHLLPNTCATTRNVTQMQLQTDASNVTSTVTTVASRRATSIMAALHAEDFCDDSNHRVDVPTKHNVLCEERSVWDVIQQHGVDFRKEDDDDVIDANDADVATEAPGDVLPSPLQFHYITPTATRYVLLLDRSHIMAQSNRWIVLRRSLSRWIHSLMDDTLLSIVASGDVSGAAEASLILGWTRVTSHNRDGLVGRIPRRPLTSRFATKTLPAVDLAQRLLNDAEEESCCGGSIILISGSPEAEDFRLDASSTLHMIAFPSAAVSLDVFSSSGPSAGLNMAVLETGSGNPQGSGRTQARLTSALLQILAYDQVDTPTQVYEESVTAGDGLLAVGGSFTLDAPLGRNVWIVAHCADEADLDTIEVVSPSGRIFDLPLVSDGMLHIRIPQTNEFGEWKYRLRFGPAAPQRSKAWATVQVTATPSTPSADAVEVQKAISVQAWTNAPDRHQLVNASQTPVLFYVEVKQGQRPILDARVTVRMYPPNGTEPFRFQLYDRGTGDPDITRADGIYSGYLTHSISDAGHYPVVIEVTNNGRRTLIPYRNGNQPEASACCGSVVPYDSTVTCPPFRRVLTGPTLSFIDGPPEGLDIYPPGRITDLRVERIDPSTNQVLLGWTAPGSDYDSGTASIYEIRCYTDRSALNDSSSAILVHASLTPLPAQAGTWQRSSVAVPWPNQLFYYAVVALDASANRGAVSNIVPAYIYEAPPPPTTLPPATIVDSGDWNSAETNSSGTIRRNASGQPLLSEQQLYAISGGVAGFLLLLLILTVVAVLSRRSRNSRKHSGSDPNSGNHKLAKIQVEPLKSPPDGREADQADGASEEQRERPVYKIYVNNAYIQEEDGELKIVTPDGRIIQRSSPWFSSSSATLPRGRSLTRLDDSAGSSDLNHLHHWSLPRSKTSPHRHKVLTNGSIMQSGGSQAAMVAGSGGGAASAAAALADGTCSISSKPSVSSDDTGIEVNDHHGADSRDSGDIEQPEHNTAAAAAAASAPEALNQMILPPPGFGSIQPQYQNHSGYLPMYGHPLVAPLPSVPPSPALQDARVVRIPAIPDSNCWMSQLNDPSFAQPSNRRPLQIGSFSSFRETQRIPEEFRDGSPWMSPQQQPALSNNTGTWLSEGPRKKRHISFV